MSIVLCGDWAGARGAEERTGWQRSLAEAMPDETLWLDGEGGPQPPTPGAVEVAIVANPPPGRLLRWPALRLVQSLWAGVDRLLADPQLPAGVPIARMVDPAMNGAMAETALWAVLSLQRDFFRYGQQQREAVWRSWPQRRADETRVTVLGLGQMGATVASRLAGLGYAVSGWRLRDGAAVGKVELAAAAVDGTGTPMARELAGVAVRSGPAALPHLLARSDVVINLLPLTPATRGLIDTRFFAAMPRGGALVNLARGAHLVETDLLAALASGQLRHAVLDVFQAEPLPPGHAFWSHPSVTVLPHVAAQTDPRSAAAVVAANVAALRAGRPLSGLVERSSGY